MIFHGTPPFTSAGGIVDVDDDDNDDEEELIKW